MIAFGRKNHGLCFIATMIIISSRWAFSYFSIGTFMLQYMIIVALPWYPPSDHSWYPISRVLCNEPHSNQNHLDSSSLLLFSFHLLNYLCVRILFKDGNRLRFFLKSRVNRWSLIKKSMPASNCGASSRSPCERPRVGPLLVDLKLSNFFHHLNNSQLNYFLFFSKPYNQ